MAMLIMAKLHCFYASVAVFFVLLILYFVFYQGLDDSSTTVTQVLQVVMRDVDNNLLLGFSCAIMCIGALVPIIYLSAKGLKKGFQLIFVASLAVGLSETLGIVLTEARPFWNNSVLGIGCALGFGLPSTNVLFVASTLGLGARYLWKSGSKAVAVVLVVVVFLAGLNQIVLGAHSYMQVIVSWALAAALVESPRFYKVHKGDVADAQKEAHIIAGFLLIVGLLAYLFTEFSNYSSINIGLNCGRTIEGTAFLAYALAKIPIVAVLPGFTTGLRERNKRTGEPSEWEHNSDKRTAVRVVFNVVLAITVVLVHWVLGKMFGAIISFIVLIVWSYIAGALSAFVTPILLQFPKGNGDLSQKLVGTETSA